MMALTVTAIVVVVLRALNEDFSSETKRGRKRTRGPKQRSIKNDTFHLFFVGFGCQKDTKKLHREIFFFFFFFFFSFFSIESEEKNAPTKVKKCQRKARACKKEKRKRERRTQLFDHHRPPLLHS